MKKLISFVLLLCMTVSLCACGKTSITMQEISDANQTEALLKNHQSVYFRDEMDGEVWIETYLSKEYFYNYMPDDEYPWLEFMADDVCYKYAGDECVLYVFITPDGVSDFASERAERSVSVILDTDVSDYAIESVSKKDGRIIVNASLGQDAIAEDEFGLTSAKFEYVLDAKTRELISLTSSYTYEDGTAVQTVTKATYDADVPEALKTILEYENRTENLRNVTVVSNPGTGKEVSQTVPAPKGLIFGFEFDDAYADAVEFFTDAACTEAYDPYADTESDLTIYVKWSE